MNDDGAASEVCAYQIKETPIAYIYYLLLKSYAALSVCSAIGRILLL